MVYAKSSYVNLSKFCSRYEFEAWDFILGDFIGWGFFVLFWGFLMYFYSVVVRLGIRGLEGFLTSLANLG